MRLNFSSCNIYYEPEWDKLPIQTGHIVFESEFLARRSDELPTQYSSFSMGR